MCRQVFKGDWGSVQMRKNRKVSSVMGWLLSFQLSEPGAGAACAVSMVGGRVGSRAALGAVAVAAAVMCCAIS